MAYRKNQTNAQIVALALNGIEGETTTGNMSTENRDRLGCAGSRGHLPNSWARLYFDRAADRAILRVIYSYSTPIAWLDRDYGWIIPRVTYSVTTSAKHQSQLYRIRDARNLAMPWDATPEDAQRVMDGRMLFITDSRSRNAIATIPGPNYVAGE